MKTTIQIIAIILLQSNLFAQNIKIYRSGSLVKTIATSSLSVPIQTAVDSAIAGDSLVFSSHVFRDRRVQLTKNLILQGTQTSTDSTIIEQASSVQSVFLVSNPSPTGITKLTFKDIIIQDAFLNMGCKDTSNIDSVFGAAIRTYPNTDVVISGNTIIRRCGIIGPFLCPVYYPFDTVFMGGGAIFSRGELTIKDNTKFIENGGYAFGAAICSMKELVVQDRVEFYVNQPRLYGTIAGTGIVTIRDHVKVYNNYARQCAGIYIRNGVLNIKDSVRISENYTPAQSGGGIYAKNSEVNLKNKTLIAGNTGGGIYLHNSVLNMDDSAVITLNSCDSNYGAGVYNKGGNINISGGQIIGNYVINDSSGGKGMAIYNDTISGSAAPIVKIANARIFNPTQLFKRTNEIFNADGVKFSSDSTWWGESDTTGLIQNAGSATTSLGSWIVADWSINKAAPIGYATTFPIEAYFKLNSGAAIPAKMFWMLKGLYACDHGTFAPDTADMMGTNIISTDYTSSDTTRLVNIIATVDADTFRHSQVITGLSIDNLQSGEKSYFEIYPNPATTFVNIKAEHAHQATTVKVYDLMGKIMLKKDLLFKYNAEQIQTNFPAGLYIIELTRDGFCAKKSLIIK